jgi:hypothetical protein
MCGLSKTLTDNRLNEVEQVCVVQQRRRRTNNISTDERWMVQIQGERRSNEVDTSLQSRATRIDQTERDSLRLLSRMMSWTKVHG